MFNSAKNKYDSDEEEDNINSINNINISKMNSNLSEIKLKSSSTDSFNENESCDTTISNAIISRDSNWSNNSNNSNNQINMINATDSIYSNNINKFQKNKNQSSFLGDNKIPDLKKIYKEEDSIDLLTLQIKYSLKKMEHEYYLNNIHRNNNSAHNNYNYCEYFFNSSNKIWENNDENPSNKTILKFNRNNEYLNKFSVPNSIKNSKK